MSSCCLYRKGSRSVLHQIRSQKKSPWAGWESVGFTEKKWNNLLFSYCSNYASYYLNSRFPLLCKHNPSYPALSQPSSHHSLLPEFLSCHASGNVPLPNWEFLLFLFAVSCCHLCLVQDTELYLLYITPLFFWSLSKLCLLDNTLKSI